MNDSTGWLKCYCSGLTSLPRILLGQYSDGYTPSFERGIDDRSRESDAKFSVVLNKLSRMLKLLRLLPEFIRSIIYWLGM